ncbi:glycine cleavage system protein GcvH [Crocinitomix catalasitica]|uniref:glycine cleavage system protein GcvH n=1 Tax=Crocinitomix catalasitica TaxID=184607 RepID=UPI000488D2B3|nr:glycine cleavage system protein GcvH [Crocinitomix catalasitica]
MNIPENLLYTQEHEWIAYDSEKNIATIGITDFAKKELGDIVFVDIETVDEELSKDDVFGSVEAVKTVSDLFMPMSGTVIQLNDEIIDQPELVNNDPYIGGWMIKVTPNDPNFIEGLLNSEAYKNMIS